MKGASDMPRERHGVSLDNRRAGARSAQRCESGRPGKKGGLAARFAPWGALRSRHQRVVELRPAPAHGEGGGCRGSCRHDQRTPRESRATARGLLGAGRWTSPSRRPARSNSARSFRTRLARWPPQWAGESRKMRLTGAGGLPGWASFPSIAIPSAQPARRASEAPARRRRRACPCGVLGRTDGASVHLPSTR